MFKPLSVAAFVVGGAANAATFNISFDSSSVDGGGTIVIDDSLIAPNARVNYLDPLVQISIEFGGVMFDSGSDENPVGGDTVFIFDALGEQIIGVDDQTPVGSIFTDFRSSTNSNLILAIDDGPVPGTFVFFDTSVSFEPLIRGTVDISRVPPPGSLPLMGAALLGFGVLRRRRKSVS